VAVASLTKSSYFRSDDKAGLSSRSSKARPIRQCAPSEQEHGMTVARELAEFFCGIAPTDLPPPAVEHAAVLVASTIASAAMGSGLESASIIRSLARERGGTPEASLWFDRGPKLPVTDAAQVNAVMSDAAASDDSDLRNIVHAGTTLVATALAVAERTGAGGEEVLPAIVLGYEAAGRIGDAITPGFGSRGFTAASSRSLAARLPPGGCCGSTRHSWRRLSRCRQHRSAD
jgi:2-methylcitrate dehydratase PrpD